tara:strand:+ start:4841 stop:5083 length:243 start_codon:yes stop_codon:yes gene_type:complete
MLLAVEQQVGQLVNLGSGKGVSVREIGDIIVRNLPDLVEVTWDMSKPSDDRNRLLDMSRAKRIGFKSVISIEEGIHETMN